MAERMLVVVGDATLREVASDCGIHRETARRYLHGATPPSLVFLAVFADRYGVSLEWLVCGRGPMFRAMLRQHYLAESNIQDVCQALGASVDRALKEASALNQAAQEAARGRERWRPEIPLDQVIAGPKLSIDGSKLELA